MTVSYLLGSGVAEKPNGDKLHERYPVFRDWLAQVEAWTGVTPHQIFTEVGPDAEHGGLVRVVPRVRSAALALGVCDILAESGVRPDAAGGTSLGGMVAAGIAGAIDRESLFGLFVQFGSVPEEPEAPLHGVALAYVPAEDSDLAWYYGEENPGVYLSCDIGSSADGAMRLLMLAGLRSDIDAMAERAPLGTVFVTPIEEAFHTPLMQRVADFVEPYIENIPFKDPEIPLYSALEQRTLRTADEVRDMFLRNTVNTVYMPAVQDAMAADNPKHVIVPGPSLPAGVLRFAFPVSHIEQPDQVAEALTALYEAGVELPRMRHADR
jgi:[acyl-carrier-protein] S-malonyltransferase